MVSMGKISFACIISFGCFAVNAQNKRILKGIVVDESQKSVPNIAVKNPDLGRTIIANQNGVFYYSVNDLNFSLQFTGVGYKTLLTKVKLFNADFRISDTVVRVFKLLSSVNELNTVDVNYSPVEQFHTPTNVNVLDFEFFSDNVLLMLNENKKYKLKLVDKDDQTLHEFLLSTKPIRFFKDCFNQTHVISNDSASQIIILNGEIQLYKAIAIDQIKRLLEPCVASTNDALVFKALSRFKQAVIYFSINKMSKVSTLIHSCNDVEAEAVVQDFYLENTSAMMVARHTMGENSVSEQKFARDVEENLMFYEQILDKEIYNPLFSINDSLVIFDHVNDSVFVYDENGNSFNNSFIHYRKENDWKKMLLMDGQTNKIFVVYEQDGIYSFANINVYTGLIGHKHKLIKHIFPENIKLYGGFAYYLTRQTNERGNNYLFRQRIE